MKLTNSHNKAEEALHALEGLKRAEVGKDFEKQLMQKIAFLPKKESLWLKYCAAAMLLLTLFNGFYLFNETAETFEDEIEYSDTFIYQPIDYTTFE